MHDTYSDHVFPGGIKCTTVTENYDELVRALDLDLRDKLAPYPYFNDARYAGPAPVEEDPQGKLLAEAIDEHRDSFRMRDFAPEFAFREEAASHDPSMHSGSFSPYWYLGQVPGKVNIRFALLPVSWTLQAGSRLRLAIAGTDADHFAQVPHGRPPHLKFTLGGEQASFIDLPLRK